MNSSLESNTTDLQSLVADLRAEGVQLWVHGDQLRYRSPRGVLDQARISSLRRWKTEIISLLNEPVVGRTTPLCSQPRPRILPLSFVQEGLWFLDQLDLQGAAYNLRMIVRIEGNLHVGTLEKAIRELVRRHEILRTCYQTDNGVGVQVIQPATNPWFELADLSSLEGELKQARMQEILHWHVHYKFDLQRECPFMVGLLKLAPREHVLIMNMHHIMMDGPSLGILLRELDVVYTAYVQGKPSPLPELQAQYADFAVWQRRWLQGAVFEEQMSYWKARLAGIPESLDLPLDRARPAIQSFRGAVVEFTLAPELVQSLSDLARSQDATLFMVLLAAFHAFLSRWSGQKDISVGLPVDGRGHAEAERLVGFFLNSVVSRADLSGNPVFTDLLREIRTHVLAAYEHRDLPFDRLVADLRPVRHLSHQPIFQVLFAYLPQEELHLADLTLTPLDIEDRTAKFDLALLISESKMGLQATFEYATDLFDRATIQRLVGYVTTLLQGIVSNPQARITELPLLPKSELHQLLVEWNDTAAPAATAHCVQELFESQVSRTPNATAVVFEGKALTYRELNARSNRLAHYLRGLRVGPDTLVGVCLERSLEMVVGLLAILKAGGAYVPLDPAYPEARLAYMLADSAVPVVITESSVQEKLPSCNATLVRLDLDQPLFETSPEENPIDLTQPSNLVYCLYTSGSTGKPKGVALEHINAVGFLDWACRTYASEHLACVLFSTSICFDISIFELFSPLVTGGTVLLVRDALALLEGPTRPSPVLINTVPSAAQALKDANAIPDSARIINLAGEPLRRELVEGLHMVAPHAQVYNLYGPTEYTLYTTYCKIAPGEKVTIGRPVSNTHIYILDERLQPVPLGSSGEIYIAGGGLARGYLGRPELTAEKFVPNPFGPAGNRMYRTGDLARYLPDKNIDFLGRIDHQVKVRGFRIELGEIESALLSCPAIAQCVVIAREDTPGDRRLIAYVVAARQGNPNEAELRTHLQSSLPDYMIPAAFVFLEALPLTPNGKIDRKALPVPGSPHMDAKTEFTAPRTPTEGLLAGIWEDVLKVERVGVHDNFFALGGHSLLATQVLARIRQSFQTEIPLREIFAAPTVAELARLVSSAKIVDDRPIPRSSHTKPPASFAQQRMWFLDQLEPDCGLYNVSVAWRLRGPLHVEALERSLDEIMRRHDVLRTVFAIENGSPLPVVLTHSPLSLPIVDVVATLDPEAATEAILEEDAKQPFDLAHGPMVRTKVIRVGEKEHVLMITVHHVVADGWSFDVLLRELSMLYGAFTNGQPSPLPELPIQYADYAIWQCERLQGETLRDHLVFWQDYLDGAPKALSLPTDHPRPPMSSYRGGCVSFDLSAELSERLRQLSQSSHVTLFMTMATAFTVLLHRYSGQDDICIGYSVGNRDRVEIEGLIGVFVNTLVLRTRLAANQTFHMQLAQVRDSMLDADAHKDLPFEKLVEELRPERDLSRHPLFQVTYNYSTTHGSRSKNTTSLPGLGQRQVTLPGLEISLVEPEYQTAKFDLSLFVSETGGGLEGDFEYSSDLFERATIERLVGHFRALLEAIVADPQLPVRDIPLLTEAERQQLMNWNTTFVPWNKEKCLHELFEEQVARSPGATAVVCEGEKLSYAELNTRANQIAHYLRSLGGRPDDLVGICVQRSTQMLVALLGVLKAGEAYVPLDPVYPSARLEYMMADSGASVLLTETSLRDKFPAFAGEVLYLDVDWPKVASQPLVNPIPLAHPSNLAYCIYTSGSTGTPKGVALHHEGAAHFMNWACHHFPPEDTARVLFSTSICFDLSILEVFLPLLSGGSVLLVKDTLDLPDKPLTIAPTLINTVPSAAQALVEMHAIAETVRTINLAGEPLQPELVQALQEAQPHVRIHNLYGPTEYTTYATYCAVRSGSKITVGHPLANTQVYILGHDDLQPLPVGVIGEIHIAGPGLARGYWRRPELTAEKFVPNPFGAFGTRMYKTGDLGHYLPDGSIAFDGRMDQQVKIRGYRIELGEIENALTNCKDVGQGVVLARQDTPGDHRLVAYVTPRHGRWPLEAEMHAQLESTLPHYMLPAAYVMLEALPMSPNGKIDRRSLPAPNSARAHQARYVAPRTSAERLLAGIWKDVLKLERVGIHDNFFELGGHSLRATQVMARIRQAFQTEIPLRELFAAPTVAGLALRVNSAPIANYEPISRASRGQPPQASFAQQRMWFLDQFEHGAGLYNIAGAWRVRGPMHAEILQRSLDEVIRRQDSLRTTFRAVDGAPVQIIADEMHAALPMLDLSARQDAEEQVRDILQREGARCFDLVKGPLFRAQLIKLDENDQVLLLTLHHAIADAWSIDVLLNELCAFYGAFLSGQAAILPDLPIQYADFAVWQRDRMQGELFQEQLSFWKRYLEGAPATLELPTDRRRPPAVSYRGAWIGFDLDPDLSERVRNLAQRLQATLFMTISAAFNVVLRQYSHQDDICIGYPLANRNRSETENLIGLFVNMLVLRTRFAPRQTFGMLVSQVRESILEGNAHQDLPFEKLVEELHPQRDPSRQPMFQVVISQLEPGELSLSSLDVSRIQAYDRTAKFDLTLFISDTREGLVGGFEYSTDLFDRATIERMIAHLTAVLEAVADDPGTYVEDLRVLTNSEQHQLLYAWNATKMELPAVCVHQLIDLQAAENPDVTALVLGDRRVSYLELNLRANQLAHYLRALGIGPERRVGICLERGVEMVVGLLGILKAGGAYVPVDPAHSRARMAHMMADSGVSLLLTQERLRDSLSAHAARILCLDADWPLIAQQPVTDPASELHPLNLAYCIYTSGSTGAPKAVEIPHVGLLNLVLWHRQFYGLGPGDRTTQVASLSFDASSWEIWASLVAGASLYLVDDQTRLGTDKIAGWLAQESITHCFLPTPLAEAALAQPWPRHMALKDLLVGGDVLHHGAREADVFRLVNHYGPTEASVVATCGVVEERASSNRPTVGRPIHNTRIYILDWNGNPVPIGVIGELHIAGVGLARGYLRRPELTAEKFIPDPFSNETGSRLYRTGDLARRLADGQIEILGRIDDQMKVRGFRIEPGEIEAVLAVHPDISKCLVMVRPGPAQEQQLVAYIVTHHGPKDPQLWRNYLKDKLPAYMVPSTFVDMPDLPLMPNGKIDRQALPVPEQWGVREHNFVSPRNAMEKDLVEIWCEVLGVDRVGIHDDFFALGGQSLLVMQVISHIRAAFGLELPLRTFFDRPTIAEIAESLETLRWLARPPATGATDLDANLTVAEI